MMIAARTAPKGRGTDNTVISLVGEESIGEISAEMKELVENEGWYHSSARDADNILKASYNKSLKCLWYIFCICITIKSRHHEKIFTFIAYFR